MEISTLVTLPNLVLLIVISVASIISLLNMVNNDQINKAVHPKSFVSVIDGDLIKDESFYTTSGSRWLRLDRAEVSFTKFNQVREVIIPSQYASERITGFVSDLETCFITTHWRVMEFKRESVWKVENGKSEQVMKWIFVKSHKDVSFENMKPYIKSKMDPIDYVNQVNG